MCGEMSAGVPSQFRLSEKCNSLNQCFPNIFDHVPLLVSKSNYGSWQLTHTNVRVECLCDRYPKLKIYKRTLLS